MHGKLAQDFWLLTIRHSAFSGNLVFSPLFLFIHCSDTWFEQDWPKCSQSRQSTLTSALLSLAQVSWKVQSASSTLSSLMYKSCRLIIFQFCIRFSPLPSNVIYQPTGVDSPSTPERPSLDQPQVYGSPNRATLCMSPLLVWTKAAA